MRKRKWMLNALRRTARAILTCWIASAPWVAAALLLLVASRPPAAAFADGNGNRSDRLNGSYKVTIRGAFTGEGTAAVGNRNVNINIPQARDAAGNRVHLHVRGALDAKGKFKATGTLRGAAVTVEGRIDPPGGVVRKARLGADYEAGELRGRIMGERNGGGNGNNDD